jgi:hypothetical protein
MIQRRLQRRRRPPTWSDLWPSIKAAAVLMFAMSDFTAWWEFSRLLERGATAPAHIKSTTIDATGRYSTDVVDYEFQPAVGATAISGVERFVNGPWRDVPPGELIRRASQEALMVRFLPSDPRVHRLDLDLERRRNRSRWWALSQGAVALLLATFGVVRLVRQRSEA